MIAEAIILAGGLGTRLRSVVADVPKCMAPVNGVPFISFIITYLKHEGVTRFIFSLGYKSEIVIDYLDSHFAELEKVYVIEQEPLGTGGAIKKACQSVRGQEVVILNGDTIFNIGLSHLLTTHHALDAACTIALADMKDFDRYGSVELDSHGTIRFFREKTYRSQGFINGGIYILNIAQFLQKELPLKFSFEKEYLEKYIAEWKFAGEVFYSYFIDIGVPEDYEAFQQKYSNSIVTNKIQSSDNDFGIVIETIGAFFELLD
jgi:D-glycero-alpha-D-manno-heptose 1-phosphate guanylyltransferase